MTNVGISKAIKAKPLGLNEHNMEGKIHSVTFYVPKKKSKFVSDALKEISKSIYGSKSPTGKVSKYINSLLETDLISRGLYDPEGEPNPAALANLIKNNLA